MKYLALSVLAAFLVHQSDAQQLSDDFNRPNTDAAVSGSETAPSPLGAQYETKGEGWAISEGELIFKGAKTGRLMVASPEMAAGPFTASVDFSVQKPTGENCAIGFSLYHQDEKNNYVARFRGGKTNSLQFIFSKGEKSKTQALPIPEALQPDTWYRFTVQFIPETGFTLSLAKRDTPEQKIVQGTIKDRKMFSGGKLGLYVSGLTRAKFDNFSYQAK